MKATRLPVAVLSLALLLLALPVGSAAKDKKKSIRREGDLSVVFVTEERLLVSDWQGRLMVLSYPEMEVVANLETASDSAVADFQVSKNGKWLAARYKGEHLRAWDLSTWEPTLMIEEGLTPTFRLHPKEDLLVVFQEKIGITQWDLRTGARIEPTIPAAKVVGPGRMSIAPNGRFVWMSGICRVEDDRWDQCIFDLRDGSTVAWADDPGSATFFATDKKWALIEEFNELVEATGFAILGEAPPGCERRPDDLLFCSSIASAVLTDEKQEPVGPAEGGAVGGMKALFKQAMQNAPAEFPGRYQWKIAATNARRRFQINSCDLSDDGEWVVVGVNSAEVLLYSTRRLEKAGLKLMGSWQQPTYVASFEIP